MWKFSVVSSVVTICLLFFSSPSSAQFHQSQFTGNLGGGATDAGHNVLNRPTVGGFQWIGSGDNLVLRVRFINLMTFVEPEGPDCRGHIRLPNLDEVFFEDAVTGEIEEGVSRDSRAHPTTPATCQEYRKGWIFDLSPLDKEFPQNDFYVDLLWDGLIGLIPGLDEESVMFEFLVESENDSGGIHVGNSLDLDGDNTPALANSSSASAGCTMTVDSRESPLMLLLVLLILSTILAARIALRE